MMIKEIMMITIIMMVNMCLQTGNVGRYVFDEKRGLSG